MARLWILILAGFAGLCAASPAGAATRPTPTQLPAGVEPVAYALTVTPDAPALTFAGQVEITVRVARPTRSIVLNAADLRIDRASLDGRAAATVSLDAEAETARFAFARPVAAGRHLLTVDYRGKVNSRPAGLFKVDYDTAAGKSAGRVLMTQFEPADARRFLPVFDEPAKKATFVVSAVVPAADLALSNMPEASTETLPGGLKRVRFATTPRMSSYLLFFGTGDFERITADVDGTRVGVVIKRGDTEKARYALAAATDLLRFYNDYFGIRYPLPKLDLIAAPGDTGGAMENWGAIQFGQTAMVIDPRLSTDADRQEVYNTVAHEMAHQWFGDLVTMAWWDDLWLNEAFASWMASKATDKFHPEWKPLLWALSDKDGAMRLDARASTHPIVREIKTVAQSEQAFDSITYQKGEAVLRMLEAYAGEDAWRGGVRGYMARHAYGNTVGDDLWAEMDRATRRPISTVAHDFTRQGGVPLVKVQGCAAGPFALTESRFRADAPPAVGTWRVPLVARKVPGGEWASILLGPSGASFPSDPPDCGPWIVNAGQRAYARVDYAEARTALPGLLPELDPADQIGLLNDANALGLAGYQPMAGFLDLAAALPASADAVAWDTAMERLVALDAAHPNGPGRDAYRAWAIGRLRPVLARVGYDRKPGEGPNFGIMRATTITVLARLGDPQVIAEARRRFEGFRRDPASLSGGTRRWVLQATARAADAATFDALHDMARAATDPLEKQRLYEALAEARDPALAARMLEIAISDEVPANIGPDLVTQVGTEHPELAWRFALAHEAALAKNLDALSRTTFIPRIAAESADPRRIDDLQAWAEKTLPKDDRGEVEVAKTRIRQAAEIERLRVPEVEAWVAARR